MSFPLERDPGCTKHGDDHQLDDDDQREAARDRAPSPSSRREGGTTPALQPCRPPLQRAPKTSLTPSRDRAGRPQGRGDRMPGRLREMHDHTINAMALTHVVPRRPAALEHTARRYRKQAEDLRALGSATRLTGPRPSSTGLGARHCDDRVGPRPSSPRLGQPLGIRLGARLRGGHEACGPRAQGLALPEAGQEGPRAFGSETLSSGP